MCVAAAAICLHNDSFVQLMVHFTGSLKSSHSVQGIIAFSVWSFRVQLTSPLPLGTHAHDRWVNEQQNVSQLWAGSLLLVTGLEECDLGLRSEQISLSFPCWRLPDLSCRWEVITTQPLGTWGQGEGREPEGRRHPLSHIRLSVSLQTVVNVQCWDLAHGWEVV